MDRPVVHWLRSSPLNPSKYSGATAEVCLLSSECNFNAMLTRREASTPRIDIFTPRQWPRFTCLSINYIIGRIRTQTQTPDTLSYGSPLNSSCYCDYWIIRGGIKEKLFFTFFSKGGGVSVNLRNPYQKILRFFFTIFDQKSFFYHFFIKGGSCPIQIEVVKKGGGVSVFWLKVKKKVFWCPP